MKENIDWIQQMRTRLENHQELVPDDLWQNIMESLDTTECSRQRKHRLFYRWMRIAAVMLIFIVGGMCYYNLKYVGPKRMQGISFTQNKITSTPEKNVIDNGYHCAEEVSTPVSKAFLSSSQPSEEKAISENMESSICISDTVCVSSIAAEKNDESASTRQRKSNNQQYKYTGSTIALNKSNKSSKREITIGIQAAKVLASQNNTSGVSMSNTLCASSFTAVKDNIASLAYYKETKHHFQPVTFGLTVSYGLVNQFSLFTGAVCTIATSDFIRHVGEDDVKDNQHLTYIGIPLGLTYDVWKKDKLSIYTQLYGQMDLNVSATVETEGVSSKIKKDRIQMSTGANVGAEYTIIPRLGFYIEPGVKYFFNNGSHIENNYKEKTLNFSLQMGLRISLNK